MNKVYYSKDFDKILNQVDLESLGKKVAIKVHFGERGCNTYMDPELVRKVYDKVVDSGRTAVLVECNVLYKGSRVNSTSHIEVAREHGFTDMDIDILDGEDGSEAVDYDGCKIGKGIEKYDSMLVVSHFKGHMGAGFGGAIKNVGMGLGSRAGKLDMHATTKPIITEDKCIGCGVCAQKCDVDAISIVDGKAKIDEELCIGCAMCISVCPPGAVAVPWEGRTNEELQKRIAEYTEVIIKRYPKTLYLNLLTNITPHCDCMGMEQEPFMDDIGYTYSDNIVAIDRASLELADKNSDGKFSQINQVDKLKQLTFAKESGLGDGKYELELL